MSMNVVNEVIKHLTAALLNTAPGEVRDALRTEAAGVVRSLATMATSATRPSDRKWAFKEFFSLIRGTIVRDAALQLAIAARERGTASHFKERANLILAQAQKQETARKHKRDVQRALRVLKEVGKIEGADAA